jgi:hypothetical protein
MKELEAEGSRCNGIHIVAHSMGNYVTHYASEWAGSAVLQNCRSAGLVVQCSSISSSSVVHVSLLRVAEVCGVQTAGKCSNVQLSVLCASG